MTELVSKKEANYRLAAPGAYRRCGSCKYFELMHPNACARVVPPIKASYDCDLYESGGSKPTRKLRGSHGE